MPHVLGSGTAYQGITRAVSSDDPNDDPGLIHARAARSTSRATWVGVVITAVGVGLTAAGFVAGRSTTTTTTSTVTKTETQTVARPVTVTSGSGGRSVPVADCAPGPGPDDDYERNNTDGTAAGPVLANRPLTAVISTRNDIDYYAVCVDRGADLALAISCVQAEDDTGCDEVYGEFPADASVPEDFEVDREASCSLPRAGRYLIRVQSNLPSVTYQLSVKSNTPNAVVSRLPAATATPDPNSACS